MTDLSEIPINPLLARLSEEDLLRRHKHAQKAMQEAKSKGKVRLGKKANRSNGIWDTPD